MSSKSIAYGILRALGIAFAIFVLGYFLYEIRSVLIYIAVAAVIALIGRPLVYFFRERIKLPNTLSVVIALLLISVVAFGILALFIPVIQQQTENLGKIDFEQFKNNISDLNTEIRNYLGVEQIGILESLKQSQFIQNIDIKTIPLLMSSVAGKIGSAIIAIFAVLFISFFFLKDSHLLLNSLLVFSKKGHEDSFVRVFDKIKNLLSRYFVGIVLQIFVLFVLYTILLSIFQIPNAFAIALICASLNIVPYIGPIVGGILIIFFVASNHLGADFSTVILPNTIYVLIGYIFCHLIDNFVNQPLIFGHSVKSHPLEIFLVIIIAGLLFGIFGMIIAVPFYTALKVIAQETLSEYKIVQKLTRGL